MRWKQVSLFPTASVEESCAMNALGKIVGRDISECTWSRWSCFWRQWSFPPKATPLFPLTKWCTDQPRLEAEMLKFFRFLCAASDWCSFFLGQMGKKGLLDKTEGTWQRCKTTEECHAMCCSSTGRSLLSRKMGSEKCTDRAARCPESRVRCQLLESVTLCLVFTDAKSGGKKGAEAELRDAQKVLCTVEKLKAGGCSLGVHERQSEQLRAVSSRRDYMSVPKAQVTIHTLSCVLSMISLF